MDKISFTFMLAVVTGRGKSDRNLFVLKALIGTLRILGHADQRSGVMVIKVPG